MRSKIRCDGNLVKFWNFEGNQEVTMKPRVCSYSFGILEGKQMRSSPRSLPRVEKRPESSDGADRRRRVAK